MLTSRAWWLLATLLTLLFPGMIGDQTLLVLVSLTLLGWFAGSALLFAFRVRWVRRDLRMERLLFDDRGETTLLWAQRKVRVQVLVYLDNIISLPYVQIEEMLPFGARQVLGDRRGEGMLDRDNSMELDYVLTPLASGEIRFEGVKIQFSDLQGLFHFKTFIRLEQTFRVMPTLIHSDTTTSTKKNQNVLMPPGINQLSQPGSGSELLDLRDYIPGDPPKTIAWKVSARRDRLITREYESEVPIRCTLFVDTSRSTRYGPAGDTPISRLVEIAASVTQANLRSRDLTGLCLFDEEGTKVIRPARSRTHLTQVLQTLAEGSTGYPEAEQVSTDSLLPLAYAFAEDTYPDLVRRDVNHSPWWVAFISPTPAPATKSGGIFRGYFLWFLGPALVLMYLLAAAVLFFGVLIPQHQELPGRIDRAINETFAKNRPIEIRGDWKKVLPPLAIISVVYWLVVLCLLPVFLKIFREVLPMIFLVRAHRMMRYRKRMSALLAMRYDLGPGGLELLNQDDEKLGKYLQRFLRDHHVPFVPKLYDDQGQYVFASPKKVDVLTNALLRAVSRGQDNELFVLMVDLVELEEHLERLLKAIKVALARHHRVMVIVPWPGDVALPAEDSEADSLEKKVEEQQQRVQFNRREGVLISFLEDLSQHLLLQTFYRLRKTLGRLQVPVICAGAEESTELILDRIDRLRGQRRQRFHRT